MTKQARDDTGHPFPVFKRATVQKVTYSATHGAIANAVTNGCRFVMVWCSTDAHIAIGATPVATTDDWPITAKVDTIVAVNDGDKVSALQQSTGGTMYVTELR